MLLQEKLRSIFSISAISLLVACGGGGTQSSDYPESEVPDPSLPLSREGIVDVPLDRVRITKLFPDGSVWRSNVSKGTGQVGGESGSVGSAIGPATDLARAATLNISQIDMNALTEIGRNEHGIFYRGLVSGYSPSEGVVFVDGSSRVMIVSAEAGSTDLLSTIGSPVQDLPTSGKAAYEGTNIFTLRDGSFSEIGTFNMTVDFGSAKGSISGKTVSTTIDAGQIAFDFRIGQFYSNRTTININGTSRDGSIYGDFHGQNASGVSAVYHENSATSPLIAGAIAGHRQ